MAISLSSIKRSGIARPPRTILYGTSGIGKSSFGASAENAIFISTEEGLDAISTSAFPLCKSWDDVMDCFGVLINEDHDFQTVVLDSLDWTERLIWAQVAADNNVKSVENIGYGKGYKAAVDYWRLLLEAIDTLRDKNMQCIMIAHSKIKRFDDPLNDAYDRYMLDLHDSAASILTEWCDVLAFANYRISTVKSDVGFNQKHTRAVGSGDRVLYTQERPGWVAKSRWPLPDTLPLSYSVFSEALAESMNPNTPE